MAIVQQSKLRISTEKGVKGKKEQVGLLEMATGRLLLKPTANHTFQTSSSSSYTRRSSQNSSRKDISQPSNSDSNISSMNIGANAAGYRNTHLARKVATQQVISTPITVQEFNLVDLLPRFAFGSANWKLDPSQTQGLIERAIIDCRFFTLLAIAGSLIGSILCFVEGFIMIMRSYLRYLEAALYKLDHISIIELVIEAIDMFLLGTAMLIFGMGLYVMFVRSKTTIPNSNGSYIEMLPSWLKMESVSEAKTRLGHAVIMILQVGMLDKFKSVPLVTGLDLASFAGAILLSSVSIFCLSKLSGS